MNSPLTIQGNIFEEYIPEQQLRTRLQQLAADIHRDYAEKEPILICVLNGAFIFFADLVRELDDLSCEIDFLGVSSYGSGTTSSGIVTLSKDLQHSVTGRDVIVVEDIVDSGLSLASIKTLLEQRQPTSLRFVSLLVKKGAKTGPIAIDYVGFEVGPEFVVGYGLDYAQKVRNLRSIYRLQQEQ
jgi:hypoxanthine phosphoribosyltransferase